MSTIQYFIVMKSLGNFLVFLLLIWAGNTVTAQSSLKDDEAQKATEVKSLVNSGRFTFEASKMAMHKSEGRAVRSGDDMDISKDTLISYLPDAGKAPDAPVTAHAAGITCTHFTYNMTPGNNGGYNVSIMPKEKYAKDVKELKSIKMHISKEGYATVIVNSTNHGAMTYHGYIMQHEARFPNATSVAVR